MNFLFFFSSRRRHTRWTGDWSSDVCSSDLASTEGSSKVKGKFAVAPLPGVNGPGASSLGGHSEAISTYSDHKQTALDFLKYITAPAQQKFIAMKGSLAPVRASLYDDPALIKKLPYLPTLKTAIANAVP